MPDVRLFHSLDGGEIEVSNNDVVTGKELETAAYLSMFGGNERDNGLTSGESLQWWANFEEPTAARRYRSEVQALLLDLPATPENLRKVEDAALRDLDWMTSELKAKVAVEATIPDVDAVNLAVAIQIGKTTYTFDIASKWGKQ